MIGTKWQPNSKKFKCAVCKTKFHLEDVHKNGKSDLPVKGRKKK